MIFRSRTRVIPVTAVLLISAVVLASCSSGDGLQQWPDPADPQVPLPTGAVFSDGGDTGDVQDDGGTPFGSLRPGDATPEQRVPDIIDRGRLIVGVSQSMNQLGFRDPVTGEMAGFEVDIAHEIARDIFGDPDRVDFRYIEGDGRDEALRDGDVDIVIRSMTVTRLRQMNVEFSIPYLTVSPRLLVNRSSGIASEEDLADKTVCATTRSTSAQSLTSIDHNRLLLTETWPDCLMAMQHGQVDAIYSDSAVLSGLLAQDPNTDLVVSRAPPPHKAFRPAPPTIRNTAGLVRQVNTTLERLRSDGTWNRLHGQWLAPYTGAGSQPDPVYRTDEESTELRNLRREAEAAETSEASGASTTAAAAPTTAADDEGDDEGERS
ncbi:MAG: transporter substrate-binding domain-containing protein [Corynebacterium variabile]|uniref:transporter substrate-binding domain-containing protein n=1 Tax=Corynebacterium variabile TaxID=1727 RepID=UPI002648F61B|nr:transporter substrate-binding domain-containing protein [Corynebacterium variabile]MDN6845524.1 transporter substrate-binding domain-containing protein [Corynebacterium variabile]